MSNIMLVTVRERTKEIGIRRALGACPRSILMQIMSESLILTLLAGFFGLFMGVALLYVVDIFMQNRVLRIRKQLSSCSIIFVTDTQPHGCLMETVSFIKNITSWQQIRRSARQEPII